MRSLRVRRQQVSCQTPPQLDASMTTTWVRLRPPMREWMPSMACGVLHQLLDRNFMGGRPAGFDAEIRP